ncbi:hypothetical protein ACIRG5_11460 [Lentzea sp. NPDC102401]|uniref:hypothetical protein n=1 Tax=Lentzea sp. NPDC102401 TaxID=3364128 RepID=UPI0037F7053C
MPSGVLRDKIELAHLSYTITGIDISAEAISHAGSQRFLADLAAATPVLVIDYGCTAESLLPSLPGEVRMSFGGVDCVAVNDYEVASGRLLTTGGAPIRYATCVT